jgi:hypothetical protein
VGALQAAPLNRDIEVALRVTIGESVKTKRAKRGSYALKLEDAAKIRYSFLYEPTIAVGDPKSLWTFEADGGVYELAFGVQGRLSDFWPDEELERFLLVLAGYINLEEEIQTLISSNRSRWIFLRRLRFFALRLFRAYVDVKNVDVTKILEQRGYFDEIFKSYWAEAARVLVDAYQQAIKDGTTLFALCRSDQRWKAVNDKFDMYLSLPAAAAS